MYTEAEVRFLRHENTALRLPAMYDIRELGAPEHLVERILRDREKRYGKLFTDFRQQNATAEPSLEDRAAASKLF